MDQLKPIIQNLVKHRFWVACLSLVIAIIVVFYLASSSVSSARDKYVSDIKSKFTSTQNLAGIDPSEGLSNLADEVKESLEDAFPNKAILDQMDNITDEAKISTRAAWGYQYQQQQKLLVFPTDLPEEVRSAFRRYLPIEQKLPKFDEMKQQDEAREEYRMAYGGYIKARLPQLAKKIGAKWRPSAMGDMGGGPMGGMSGGPMGGGPSGGNMFGGSGGSDPANPMGGGSSGAMSGDPSLADDGSPEVVAWNLANQAKWLERATSFAGINFNRSPNNVPTTHQVMYVQEDLWVLEAIFDVIKQTNGDADANDLAPIKTVDHILLGQDAGSVGEMSSLEKVGAMGGADRNMADMMKAMSEGMSGGSSGGDKDEKAAESDDPAHMRYVDKDFQLIEAENFHDDISATSPDKAYLQVAKRIPVRLGFQMKETAILDLLSECANSDPPIEVRQVRINQHSAEAGSSILGGPGAGMDPMAGAMGAGAAGGESAADEVEQDTASDVIGVEIYGVVYIYNPVPEVDDEQNILKLANPDNDNGQTAMRSPAAPEPTDG
ncbi:MAG: hypothetical protein VXY07_11860 [Planctomycetota bacterium]|nr:hypothetical protein [Planctomycetota bacterium]MEC8783515.1 hypothetical protein [Planctomycetota bacterium]MEC9148949.1 hypothetical protein [Planctomycetota bacterium]MEE3031756.1 hypothetical protein [Planctomycetota bacterium]